MMKVIRITSYNVCYTKLLRVTDMNQVVQEAQLLLTEKMRLDKQAPAENKLLANALDSDVAFTFVRNNFV